MTSDGTSWLELVRTIYRYWRSVCSDVGYIRGTIAMLVALVFLVIFLDTPDASTEPPLWMTQSDDE